MSCIINSRIFKCGGDEEDLQPIRSKIKLRNKDVQLNISIDNVYDILSYDKNESASIKVFKIGTWVIGGLILACLFALLFGYLVMILWNWLMPTIFNLPTITFFQAFGIVLLSKILFSGFGKGWHDDKGKKHFQKKMKEKCKDVTKGLHNIQSTAESDEELNEVCTFLPSMAFPEEFDEQAVISKVSGCKCEEISLIVIGSEAFEGDHPSMYWEGARNHCFAIGTSSDGKCTFAVIVDGEEDLEKLSQYFKAKIRVYIRTFLFVRKWSLHNYHYFRAVIFLIFTG